MLKFISTLVIAICISNAAFAKTIQVGPGQTYTTISSAIAASTNGDVIDVQAGVYQNDTAIISTSITLQAIGGRVSMPQTVPVPNQKGIFVVGTSTTSPTVVIEGFDFSGAATPNGNNGAGIVFQSGNLTLVNDTFFNNQDGIRSAPNTSANITIDHCEIYNNGINDGLSHDIYIGENHQFTIQNSYIHDSFGGHQIKSRADNTTIVNNRIFDNTGNGSYQVDIPQGGNVTITGNIIEQGPNSSNPTLISYGEEHVTQNPGTTIIVSNNVFVNDYTGSPPTAMVNQQTQTATLTDNSYWGITSAQIKGGVGPTVSTGDIFLNTRPTLDTTSSPLQISTTYYWQTISVDLGRNPSATPNLSGGQITLYNSLGNNGALINFIGQQFVGLPSNNSVNGVISANLATVNFDNTTSVETFDSSVEANFQQVGNFLQGSGKFQTRDETIFGGTNDPTNPNVWTLNIDSYVNGCSGCVITGTFVTWWHPDLYSPWQWMINHPLSLTSTTDMGTGLAAYNGDTSPITDPIVYDIDGFDNPASTVASLHAMGKKVVCYIEVGAAENYRSDYSQFPASALGKVMPDYSSEKYIDIRDPTVVSIIKARIKMCADKGFDAIEPDIDESYLSPTGFPLTKAIEENYMTDLANYAHSLGLAMFGKNPDDTEDSYAADMVNVFDAILTESCNQYNTCSYLNAYTGKKAIFNAEYKGPTSAFCPADNNRSGWNGALYKQALSGYRAPCR